MISCLDDHLSALYRLRRFGIQLGLGSISRLMQGLGNPQKGYASVHVAGTNGKGSIAALLSCVLVEAGYTVGLYTSPHLVRFNERIQVNGRPVSDDDVVGAAEAVQRIYTQGEPPTFFECATAMAFYHFARAKVDMAVLETGMGGRYDATNVIAPEVAIISNVSIEHTQYLGKTIARIAREKAGIIKKGCGVVTGVKQHSAMKVISNIASRKAAPLLRLGKEIRTRKGRQGRFSCRCTRRRWQGLEVGLLGQHQISNAALALGAIDLLTDKGWHIPDAAVFGGLRQVRWPGRLEVVCQAPLIMLDGAHNPAAVRNLTSFLRNALHCRRLTLVVGILRDKSWKVMLGLLAGVARNIILTSPDYERAADPYELASFARGVNPRVTVVPGVTEALSRAINKSDKDDAICVTGSLYTVGEAKAYLETRPQVARGGHQAS